eukprot:SAG31_NODE_6113_length_2165_cov_8.036302_2_plen_189_part_00
MPEGIFICVAADPNSTLAARFRLYARASILPVMQQVRKLLESHAAVVELPPAQWLEAKFPHEYWKLVTAEMFCHFWIARASSWQAVIREWDSSDFGTVVPRGNDWFPFGGLHGVIDWATNRSQSRQRELIGMTAATEVPVDACEQICATIQCVMVLDGLNVSLLTADRLGSHESTANVVDEGDKHVTK